MSARMRTTVAISAAVVFLFVVLAGSASLALRIATDFNGYPTNGAFQIYNPLRRLGAGEVPGRDFPFFHGVGTLLVHTPVFALLGGGLFASEMSRWLTSPVLFVLSTLVASRLLLTRWRRAIVATAVCTAITIPLGRMFDPSNSLLGLRTMFPMIACALLAAGPGRVLATRGPLHLTVRDLALAVTLGLAVVFATEQGLAAVIGVLVVRAAVGLREVGVARAALRTVVDGALVALVAFLLLSMVTRGDAISAVRYALIDVPADQGWVFGTPPNTSFSFDAFFGQLTFFDPAAFVGQLRLDGAFPFVPVYFIVGAGAALLVGRAVRSGALGAGTTVAAAGLVAYSTVVLGSMTGYVFLVDQLAPFARACALLAGVGATALLLPDDRAAPASDSAPSPARLRRALAFSGLAVLCAVPMLYTASFAVTRLDGVRAALDRAPDVMAASDRAILGAGWAANMAEIDALVPEDASTWATYTSVVQSIRGEIGGSSGGEDYIIHALGDERREAYTRSFVDTAPDAVLTMNPSRFVYEEWLWSRWPEFYGELVRRYEHTGTASAYDVWTRLPEPAAVVLLDAPLRDSAEILLPENRSERVRLLEITVQYDAVEGLPLLDRTSRYLLYPAGTGLSLPVSLPPGADRWTFLVPVMPGQTAPRLDAGITGPFGGRLDLLGVDIREVLIPASSDAVFVANACVSAPDAPYCPTR